jgi:hypothetical protein
MLKTALSLPIVSKRRRKAREAFFAKQPTIYICFILAAALLSCAYAFRTHTLFACQADGYSTDRYIAYCNGENYGEYEHGAFYFDLEPSAQYFSRDADVLFLGNSRLQVALSTAATANWFSAAEARYYLMGFAYFENMNFTEKLLSRIRPRARVYVINIDDFFDRSETPPVKTILHDPEARRRYEVKRLWQLVHEPICKPFARLCGDKFVIFRSRETGAYYEEGGAAERKITPVSYDQVVNQKVVSDNATAAIDFVSLFAQGKCVILTMVPFVGTKIANANAIATRLGMKLVTPGPLQGLQTFDGYHLDRPSAERWSQAFFQIAGSSIRSCLEK